MPVAFGITMFVFGARGIATQEIQSKTATKESLEDALLTERPGRHVIFVRYHEGDSEHREWVYNPADIDAAPVIWAQDLGTRENKRLIQYYTGRSFWLFEPYGLMKLQPY
jgi:hypothetical protein